MKRLLLPFGVAFLSQHGIIHIRLLISSYIQSKMEAAMARKKRVDPKIIYIPPRVNRRLSSLRSSHLTLVEAPGGYGKTTALDCYFRDQIPRALPLYACDLNCTDPNEGWRQLCDRFAEIDPDCARRMFRAGVPNEDNISRLRTALQELVCPYETYLWLDNYLSWPAPCADRFLALLARSGGKGLHVVVSTRPLPREILAVLLQNDGVSRLTQGDFTFTPEDTLAYFQEAGVDLTPDRLREVQTLTGGQIMALYLELLAWLDRGRFEQGGVDHLLEHIFWPSLNSREQDFLLSASVFPSLTLVEASRLTGLDVDTTYDRLLARKAFFRYDGVNRRFTPNVLLLDFLRRKFAALPQEHRSAIYVRAGQLAEEAGDRKRTLSFYYRSGDWERLFSQPISSYDVSQVTDPDTAHMILDLLENTPLSIQRRYPAAVVPLAFGLFFLGENEKLARMQGEIRRVISEGDLDQQEKDALLGEMELLIGFLEYNRIEDMSAHHRRAMELLGGPTRLINLKSTWTFGSPSILFLYWRESGKLNEELEQMDACMPIYYQLTRGHGYGAELIMRAEALFVRGEAEAALPLCYQGLCAAASKQQTSVYQCGLFLLCRIAVQTGNAEQLEVSRQALRDQALRHQSDLGASTLDLVEGYLSLLLGNPEEVPSWLLRGEINNKRLVVMAQPFALIICGRTLLFHQEYDKVLGICEHCLELSRTFSNLLPQVYANLYMALCMAATGRKEAALDRLRLALELAMPDRVYMPFVENYHLLRPLFQNLTGVSGYQREISRLYHQYEKAWGGITRRFTPRERDVLRLLKEDLTNKAIAERLGLSPNTVRNTLSGMLKKKGLSSRDQLKPLSEEA